MFEQIIKNLQKQEKLSNSQTFLVENNSSLEKSRNEAKENLSLTSITKSC